MRKKQFVGKLDYLSNMYPHKMYVQLDGVEMEFSCLESAFQACKSEDSLTHQVFQTLNGYEAKRLGRQIPIRGNWKQIRVEVMYQLLKLKFSDPYLVSLLIMTPDDDIVEHNTWNDTFWGVCNGRGEDNLGKLIRKIKQEKLV